MRQAALLLLLLVVIGSNVLGATARRPVSPHMGNSTMLQLWECQAGNPRQNYELYGDEMVHSVEHPSYCWNIMWGANRTSPPVPIMTYWCTTSGMLHIL